jgi:hypothetical protein
MMKKVLIMMKKAIIILIFIGIVPTIVFTESRYKYEKSIKASQLKNIRNISKYLLSSKKRNIEDPEIEKLKINLKNLETELLLNKNQILTIIKKEVKIKKKG